MEVPMVKRNVYGDEWYPVFSAGLLAPGVDYEYSALEFTEEEAAELDALFAKFEAWQEELQRRIQDARLAWIAANAEEHKRRTEEFKKERKRYEESQRRR
jgi:hypothetical protein